MALNSPEAQAETRPDTLSRLLAIAEKLVLPVVLAAITYIAKSASDEIARSQVAVAEQNVQVARLQLERQQTEAIADRQLKYLELAYRDLQDPDPRRQQAAISVLYAMQPDLAKAVAGAARSNPMTPISVRESLNRFLVDIDRFGPLLNYRIIAYHAAGKAGTADVFRRCLQRLGFNSIELRADNSFAGESVKLGYHVRFDDVYETEAAQYLARLGSQCLQKPLRRVTVTGRRTDGTLTVFFYDPASP